MIEDTIRKNISKDISKGKEWSDLVNAGVKELQDHQLPQVRQLGTLLKTPPAHYGKARAEDHHDLHVVHIMPSRGEEWELDLIIAITIKACGATK